ncbi:MAG TPA: right-handed parallel beta-helix repeat-containing protein [Candidatus Limnocylindrales bacterium]
MVAAIVVLTGCGPQPSPSGSAATASPTAPDCTTSAQPLLDAAAPGATVVLPACVHRETLVIDKPLTLGGSPGAEIRGSDVWTAWTRGPDGWVSGLAVPAFKAHGSCRPGTRRCLWPEQVFVDGAALTEVAPGSRPGPGQFALDAGRHVVLATDPAGHEVEVTTRTRWVVTDADGIVIEGLRMRHAANDAQEGAITDEGHDVLIRDCVLSDTHGAVVSLTGSGGLIGDDIFRGGQLGVHQGGAFVEHDRIHDNNVEGFDPAWEAGGLKSTRHQQLVSGNEVYGNDGPGLWWDIHADGARVLDNRVHDNRGAGIVYEISSGGRLAGNAVWANGFGLARWGAGILVSSAADVEVDHNTLAWDADGIVIVSQDRPDAPSPSAGIRVHDNVIVGLDPDRGRSEAYGLAWIQDWSAGVLFAPAAGNVAAANRFWFPSEEAIARFAWDGRRFAHLADFAATPGGAGSSYLETSAAESLLGAAGVPRAGLAAGR